MRDTIEPTVRVRLKHQGEREAEEVDMIVEGALAIVQVKGMVWGPGHGREVREGAHHLRGADIARNCDAADITEILANQQRNTRLSPTELWERTKAKHEEQKGTSMHHEEITILVRGRMDLWRAKRAVENRRCMGSRPDALSEELGDVDMARGAGAEPQRPKCKLPGCERQGYLDQTSGVVHDYCCADHEETAGKGGDSRET
eukprot:2126853-Rhodomonas_salina.2